MRVLTVGNMYPPHHRGGYELVWRAAVEHLRARGHEVRVLTTDVDTGSARPDDPDVHRGLRWHLRDGAFERTGLRARTATARHNHRALERHVDALKPDVVAWWSMGGLTMTLMEAVRRRGIPAVAFVHDDWLAYGPRVDPWTRMFLGPRRRWLAALGERLAGIPAAVDFGAAAGYVFVSDFMRRRALGLGLGIASARASVAHSGIDPRFLVPGPEPRWTWQLLYVGRLDPRKGVDTAVAALAHLPSEARLVIVGGGDRHEESRLREQAAALGVADRVEFSGHRGHAPLVAAYDRADVVLFPVRWDEPWGLVPLEAMGRGRPVVATGRGGSAEYLAHEDNCLLVEAGDPAALAAAIQRLADDPALRSRTREGGFLTAARHTEQGFNETVERALVAAAADRP